MRSKSASAEKLVLSSPSSDKCGRVGFVAASPEHNKGARRNFGFRSPSIHWRPHRPSVRFVTCAAILVALAVSTAATIGFLRQQVQKRHFVEELRVRRREAPIAFEAARITNTFYWQSEPQAPWRQVVREWEDGRSSSGTGQLAGSLRRFGSPPDTSLDATTKLVATENSICGGIPASCDAALVDALTLPEFQSPPTPYWGRPQVPTAFVLYAHTFETLHGAERLLYWLYAEEHTFVFHVDQKAPEAAIFYLRQKYGGLKNVGFAPRSNVAWGSWEVVQAELDSIQVARRMSNKWKFVISLCGATALIKPARYLDYYLKTKLFAATVNTSPAKSNVTDTGPYISVIPTQHLSALDSRNRFRAEHEKRVLNYSSCEGGAVADCDPYSNTPGAQPWWKGAQWKIMSRDFAEYALDSPEGKAWIQFFKTGFIQNGCTDETWAQTIMMNSEFHKRNFLPTVSVYDMWHVQGVVVCSYTDHRPGIWPGMSPCYLSLWEYDDIVSTPLAFARKFRFNDPVIERIREDIIFGPLMAAGDSEQFEQWAEQAANVSPPQA